MPHFQNFSMTYSYKCKHIRVFNLDNKPHAKQFKVCNSTEVPVLKKQLDCLYQGQGDATALMMGSKWIFSLSHFNRQHSGGIRVSSNVTPFSCFQNSGDEHSAGKWMGALQGIVGSFPLFMNSFLTER